MSLVLCPSDVPGLGRRSEEADHGFQLRRGQRSGEEVALHEIAVRSLETGYLARVLDPFGHCGEPQGVREPDDALDEVVAVRFGRDCVYERFVDLQAINGKTTEMAERREGRPEVVEGQADAELLEPPQALLRSDGVDQQRGSQ